MRFTKRFNPIVYTICLLGFLLTFHAALPAYLNSSFLESVFGEESMGLLFTLANIGAVIIFLAAPYLIRLFGNYRLALIGIVFQFLALGMLVISQDSIMIALAFIGSITFVNLLTFSSDEFLESVSVDRDTGRIRGLFLSAINTAWLLSPLLAGTLVTEGFEYLYLGAMFLLIPAAALLIAHFRNFKDPVYEKPHLWHAFRTVLKNRTLGLVLAANLLLQFFYAWMVIFSPLYLHDILGFSYETIGVIFTIMLLPFVIFGFSLGPVVDKKGNEKEFMAGGFLVMAIATAAFAFTDIPNAFLFALILFLSRVGAAIAEAMIEIHFFKHISNQNIGILSLFRTTRFLPYLIVSPIAIAAKELLGFGVSFYVLAGITLLGTFVALGLKRD